ncbi:MAG: TraR/DksA C4-type zinc finger protein [Bacteroidota bacterium]
MVSKPIAKVTKPVAKATKPVTKAPKAKLVAPKVIKPAKTEAEKVKIEVSTKPFVPKPIVKKSSPKKTEKVVEVVNDETTEVVNVPNESSYSRYSELEMAEDKKRYSDVDLAEFKELINSKLSVAQEELTNLLNQMASPGFNSASDTDSSYSKIDDGAATSEKEYLSQLAARQRKFIENLENALIRIENKTYGICRVTGKLISKERLRAVPHTTLSMEAKLQQYK